MDYYINGVLNTNPPPYDTIFTALSSGTYSITVSDNAYCDITVPIDISAPGFPLQLLIEDTLNTCFGQNTANTAVTGAGGTPRTAMNGSISVTQLPFPHPIL